MNKQVFSMAAIVIGLVFSSCSKIKGDGPVVTEYRSVAHFSAIRSALSADVYVRQDSIYKVEIHAQRNIIDVLNTTVSGGELKIDYDHNKSVGSHDRVEIFISSPQVSGLSVSGSGNITAMNKLTTTNMNLMISGSGSVSVPELHANSLRTKISGSGNIIVLSGIAGSTDSEVSGSGYVDLIGVESSVAETRISGSGDIKVLVRDALNVKISGSGDVYYRGNPKVSASISGSGKVRAL